MRNLAAIIVATVLILCLVVPASSVAQPVKELETGSPSDLSVLKLPTDLAGGSPLGGNPHGTPPGKDKEKPPPEEPTANKWAVVIGIADYQGGQNDLWHPDEDAKEMREALVNNYGFPEGNIKILLNRKAKANAIVDAIDWLAGKENAESTVVFFFSGHGYQVADSEGWDSDIEVDGIDECIVSHDMYGLPDGFLRDKFSAFDTAKFALIFGSCYSGGMFDTPDVDLQAPGRVICSACKADQYGYDYLLLGNTLFGYYFVDEGILQGLAEGLRVSGDGVSIEEALDYAYSMVTAEQPESEPQIYDAFAGKLVP